MDVSFPQMVFGYVEKKHDHSKDGQWIWGGDEIFGCDLQSVLAWATEHIEPRGDF